MLRPRRLSLTREGGIGTMMAWFIWWNALPAVVRRLIGAVFILGAIALAVLAYGHRREKAGYSRGFGDAEVIELRKQQVILNRAEAASDSLHALRVARDSLLTREAAPVVAALASAHHIRLTPSDTTVDTVGVTVETTGAHYAIPRAAAMEWFHTDSLLGVATTLLAKYADANKQWSDAWTAEHNARLGADSLAAQYRTLALANVPAPAVRQHRLLYMTLGAAVALGVRALIHH